MWIIAERSKIKHTIISTGNGIYSFYCRKRKHLQWQRWKKKVNSFASFLLFFCFAVFVLAFEMRHLFAFKMMSFHFIFMCRRIWRHLCAYKNVPVVLCTWNHVHCQELLRIVPFRSISLTTNQLGLSHMSLEYWIIFREFYLLKKLLYVYSILDFGTRT